MDEIIQKLKTFYKEKSVFFDRLNEFSDEAKECWLNVEGDQSGLEIHRSNYQKVVQKIAQELGCETEFKYDVLDYAFDLKVDEEAIKVAYADNKLDLYEI